MVVHLERPLRILIPILRIKVDPGIVDQDVNLAMPADLARQSFDAVPACDVELWIQHLLLGRSRKPKISTSPRRSEEFERVDVRFGEDELADRLADAAVLCQLVSSMQLGWRVVGLRRP